MSVRIRKMAAIIVIAFVLALVAPFVLDAALGSDENTVVASAYIIPYGRGDVEAPASGTGRGSSEAPASGTGRGSSEAPGSGTGRKSF